MYKRYLQALILLLVLIFEVVYIRLEQCSDDTLPEPKLSTEFSAVAEPNGFAGVATDLSIDSFLSTEVEYNAVTAAEPDTEQVVVPTADYAAGEYVLGNEVYKTQDTFENYVKAGFVGVDYLDSTGRPMLPVDSVDVSANGDVNINAFAPTGEPVVLRLRNMSTEAVPATTCKVTSIEIDKEAVGLSLCSVCVGDNINTVPDYQIVPESCSPRWNAYDVSGDGSILLYVYFEDDIVTGIKLRNYRILD